jgi:hypothetical protein
MTPAPVTLGHNSQLLLHICNKRRGFPHARKVIDLSKDILVSLIASDQYIPLKANVYE